MEEDSSNGIENEGTEASFTESVRLPRLIIQLQQLTEIRLRQFREFERGRERFIRFVIY
jgi:hypothetical protein